MARNKVSGFSKSMVLLASPECEALHTVHNNYILYIVSSGLLPQGRFVSWAFNSLQLSSTLSKNT